MTYALAESWPRWVANYSYDIAGPLDIPEKAANYLTAWVHGAKQVYNITLDWLGLWNEHWEKDDVMFGFAKELRRQLDAAGLQATRIIGPDAFTAASEALCRGMQHDAELSRAIDAIGVHGAIPGAGSACQQLAQQRGLPLFASEDGSTWGDTSGALQRVSDCNMFLRKQERS